MNSEAKDLSHASDDTTGHTPGPWTAEVDSYYKQLTGWINAANGSVVEYAGCGSHGADWPNPADLTLALAAPDLLAALKGVVAVADRKTDEFDAARAAIAKAEGR